MREPWTREHIEAALRLRPPRRYPLPGFQRAAVLVALFQQDGETRLWLLRRRDDGSPHGGQVALPGGKAEAGDRDLQATALREAYEEVRLPPHEVQMLGQLDERVTITRYRVTPFVGWLDHVIDPSPNPGEVSRVFSAPLAAFGGVPDRRVVKLAGFERTVNCRVVDGEIVWGATFAMLRKLARRLAEMARDQ